MFLRYVLAWLPMVLIGITNGVIREFTYGKKLSELRAHQLSTLTGILLFSLYIGWLIQVWQPTSIEQAITIGVMWLGMTIGFEFLFGHYVAGHSWTKLLSDYNLRQGRVWLLVLLWIAAAPPLFYRLFDRESP